ncbi:MAG: Aspartyl-tRNA(Asn) amidotransferase subunit B @ Glutamyl-tRNA(Gln) amidotransferase subunit B, partial [uncultured Chloroflexia bacterium]
PGGPGHARVEGPGKSADRRAGAGRGAGRDTV